MPLTDDISYLVDLSKRLCEETLEYHKKEESLLPLEKKFLQKVDELQIIPLSGHRISYHTEIETKPGWTLIINEIFNKISKEELFLKVVKSIVEETIVPKNHDNPGTQTEYWLQNFFNTVMQNRLDSLYYEQEPRSTVSFVSSLLSELNDGPLLYNEKMTVQGVFLNSSVRIQNCTVRKIEKEDIQEFLNMSERDHSFLPSCILEFEKRDKKNYSNLEIEKVMDILRLFKVGSVAWMRRISKTDSLLWVYGQSIGTSFFTHMPSNSFIIEDNELDDFKIFSNLLFSVLDNKTNESNLLGFKIALERYRNATLDQVDDARRLMTAVIGLEALYIQKHEMGEIKYRLSLRIAKLLGYFDENQTVIRQFVEKAYGFRNTIGHGGELGQKENTEVQKTLKQILDILRKSIIIFGLLLLNSNKSEIIFGIDELMLDMKKDGLKMKINEIKEKVPKSVLKTTN